MKIILILLLPLFLMAQQPDRILSLFPAGSDTITSITVQDTVQYRLWISGVASDYYTLGTYVSAANKTGEQTVEISLSDDSNWMWAQFVDVKVYQGANAITSNTFPIGRLNGAVTLFLKPDTVGTNTLYNQSVIGGN